MSTQRSSRVQLTPKEGNQEYLGAVCLHTRCRLRILGKSLLCPCTHQPKAGNQGQSKIVNRDFPLTHFASNSLSQSYIKHTETLSGIPKNSVQIQIQPKYHSNLYHEKSDSVDSVDFGNVAFSMETVIQCYMQDGTAKVSLLYVGAAAYI